jgi:hypothetical protein
VPRIEHPRKRGSSPLLLVAALSVLVVGAAACSSSSPTTATGGSPNPTTPAATSPPATSSPAGGSSDSGVSGAWSGTYGGSFSGTFKLAWRQSGSKLHGIIRLNGSDGATTIDGTVNGSNIQFGTVGGSQDITYTGTVNGNSMSGTYKVKTASGSAPGTWSAHKTS